MNIVTRFMFPLFLALSIASCTGQQNENTDGDNGGANENESQDLADTSGTGNTGSGTTTTVSNGTHQVLAFNDLGMHCADLDYSTFVILPPFNVVHSQVIERGATPRILDDSQVNVSYQAVQDGSGSITTTSQNQAGAVHKSNFWDTNPDTGNAYVYDLFGLNPPADEGIAFGQKMPGILNPYVSNDPQPFNEFNTDKKWFAADGIPILPIDDDGQLNAYPLMHVSAATTAGEILASVDVVLPVASEADCQNCHSFGEVGASDVSLNYVMPDDINDPNSVLQAAKQNILVLHDDKHGTSLVNEKPVLCASCHYSAALDLAGSGPVSEQVGRPTMSNVMHSHHGKQTDPANGDPLFPANGTLEETCYQCHPGKVTKCLRGAMGGAGIECVDCHGSMQAVGSAARQPWLDEPRCESCHTGDAVSHLGSDIRQRQAWDGDINSPVARVASNKRFAENPGTLYRNSLGHGGVACEGCHGSTHAIWPNALPSANDNLAATQLQGHAGTISECGTCHTSLPRTLGGPHGMHNVNERGWNLGHESFYKRDPAACRACHGQNLEGTVLSRTAADRDFLRDDDGNQTVHLSRGTAVSCDLCHRKPR